MELEDQELKAKLEARDKEERGKEIGDKKEKVEKEEKQICAAFIRGDCQFGWKGKQCQYKHPNVCIHLEKTGYNCEGCDKHHPDVCPSRKQYRLCFKQNCLKYHRLCKDIKPGHLPHVPLEGGWDGRVW